MDPHHSPLYVGAVFSDISKLKLACKQHTIQTNFEFSTVKSDSRRYTIKCQDEDCHWYLHASNIENIHRFMIKKLSETHDYFGLMYTVHKQTRLLRQEFKKNSGCSRPILQ